MAFTDEQLRDWARKVVLSCTEDIDYMGVGEQLGEQWAGLSDEEFDDMQSRVHGLATSATVTVSWPGEQDEAEVERLRARVAEMEEDSDMLAALRAAGVDNWGGWDHAMELLGEEDGRG